MLDRARLDIEKLREAMVLCVALRTEFPIKSMQPKGKDGAARQD
jgi:hypothetical protein